MAISDVNVRGLNELTHAIREQTRELQQTNRLLRDLQSTLLYPMLPTQVSGVIAQAREERDEE